MYRKDDIIDYKLKPGRGRPSVGRVLEVRADSLLVEAVDLEHVTVPLDAVKGFHVTRYTPRQPRLL